MSLKKSEGMTRAEFIAAVKETAIPARTRIHKESILFNVEGDVIRFTPVSMSFDEGVESSQDCLVPEFHCESWNLLLQVLHGNANLDEVVRDGKFSTNGYLPLVFTVLALFQQTLAEQPPP